MKLWLAWIVALIATFVLTISLNALLDDTGLADVDSPLLARFFILSFWLVGAVGTPLIAYYKGRRWWLWLLLGLFGQILSFFAVAFVERPTPPISPEEREQILTYYGEGAKVTAFQTREADIYNSALLMYGNNLRETEPLQAMLEASERLALSAKECMRRYSELSPIPPLAAEDYAAWGLVFMDYSAWADAQHDVFVALSQGYTPVVSRVQELMAASEKSRKAAEGVSKRLLQRARFDANDLAQLYRITQDEH